MKQENKNTIQGIKEFHEKSGFKCKREFEIIRENSQDFSKNRLGKIDLMCVKGRTMKFWEIEHNSGQVQSLENERDLGRAKKQYGKKGYFVSTCHMKSSEDFRRICK